MTLDELESFFYSTELPQTLRLNAGENVVDVKKLVHGHIAALRGGLTGPIEGAFVGRLLKIRELILAGKQE